MVVLSSAKGKQGAFRLITPPTVSAQSEPRDGSQSQSTQGEVHASRSQRRLIDPRPRRAPVAARSPQQPTADWCAITTKQALSLQMRRRKRPLTENSTLMISSTVTERNCAKNVCVSHNYIGEVIIMIWTIAIILFVLWLLGFAVFNVAGGLIHLLLVLAVIAIAYQLITGRKVV